MNYIILIILLGFFIQYKYKFLYNKYGTTTGASTSTTEIETFNDKGIKIQVPQHGRITLVSDQLYNPIYYLGSILEQSGEHIKNNASPGSEYNLQSIINGKADFGLCNEKMFLDTYLGNNNRVANTNLEFVMAFFREHIYIVSLHSYTPEDFDGKNIWIGNVQNSSFYYLNMFANIYGYGLKEWNEEAEEEKESRVIYFTQGLLTDSLINFIGEHATIDALFIVSGPKLRYIMDINNRAYNKYFYITEFTDYFFESIMGSLVQKNHLNTEIYNDPTRNYRSLYGSRVILFCHKKMDDKYVYNFVKKIIKNIPFITNSMHKWGRRTFDEDLQNYSYHYKFKTPEMLSAPPNIKIHNGTRKYMKEIGLITRDPTTLCEFDHENNQCESVNPLPATKKPLWKLQEVDFPTHLFNWNKF